MVTPIFLWYNEKNNFYGIMKKISRRSDNYGKNDSYR